MANTASLLPSVEKLLACDEGRELAAVYSRVELTGAIRAELGSLREEIRKGDPSSSAVITPAAILERARAALAGQARPRLRRVVNATGIVLHTNLGRAVISRRAAERAREAAEQPCALELDLDTGRRGHRDGLVERHVAALTGAEAATVVNNNAAAVLLLLNTLAEGKEVVVSRGELVEIGGSFRIPEIMKKGGAALREVGTTNRTHRDDYARAIGPSTALLLKVHTSNYRVVGFTATVELAELRALADEHPGVWVAEDLGSGALVDLAPYGLGHEPLVAERIAAGADVVTFSGDKLLGGPQCGVLAGTTAAIERMRRNPLMRALRCDKMTLAALEETLRSYRFDSDPIAASPVLATLTRPVAELDAMAAAARSALEEALGDECDIDIVRSEARVGAGARPDVAVESRALSIRSRTMSVDALAARFRSTDPPIIGRIENDRLILDVRTIAEPTDLVPRRRPT